MQSNAKIEFLRKRVGQQRYPNQLNGSPPLYDVHVTVDFGIQLGSELN